MVKTAAAVLILAIITAPSTAKVYQVGDEAGWNSDIAIGNDYATLKWTNYRVWAATKVFYVGDILLFNYDKRFDSVLQVTQEDEWFCITSNPIAIYNSGSDAVTLDAPGDYFFISGVYDHCWEANQKLQVYVNPIPTTPAPAPSMSVSSPAPPPSMHVSPAPRMSFSPSPASSTVASNSTGSNNNLSYILLVYATAVAAFLVIV